MGILIHDSTRSGAEENTLKPYVSKPEKWLDMLTQLGWDKIEWSDEEYEAFCDVIFCNGDALGAMESGDIPQSKRVEVIREYENFTKFPEVLRENIKLTEEDFEAYKWVWSNRIQREAEKMQKRF